MEDVHPQDEIHCAPGTQPGAVPKTPHAPEPVLQPTINDIAIEAPAPPHPDDETDQEVLGIGTSVTLPWQYHVTEE